MPKKKKGYSQKTKKQRAKIVYALAQTTPGGKGPINKRRAYKKRV